MRWIRESSSALGVALAVACSACSSELPAPIPTTHHDSVAPRRGGMLTTASFGDVRTIDPANVGDGLVVQVLEGLFAGLVDYDLEGNILPDLADRWTTSEDGRAIRFVLREGARFHDGEEVSPAAGSTTA